jgi:uncharacterized phiE125 gp8 family phage protein
MKLITRPVPAPVTLEEAKTQLRVDHTDDDVLIKRLITAARQHVENHTRQRIVRQKWRIYFNAFSDEMDLAPAHVREVEAIQYIDVDGNTQTAAASLYDVDISGQRVLRGYSQTWPSPRYQKNAVWMDVWSGMYDETESPIDNVANIDESVKQAVLMLVSEMYENTEVNYGSSGPTNPSPAFEMLLQPYRVYDL